MVQSRGGLGFTAQPLQRLGIAGQIIAQELQGNEAV
jgi:hypothetical protein